MRTSTFFLKFLLSTHALRVSSSLDMWPFAADLAARYDGVFVSSTMLTLSSLLLGPASLMKELNTLFGLGLLGYNANFSASIDEEAIRLQMFAQVKASSENSIVNWFGLGMASNGHSQWIHPLNKTEYEPVSFYHRNATSSFIYQANIGGKTSKCKRDLPLSSTTMTIVNFCLKDWRMNTKGEIIQPPIKDYGRYDPRERPFYQNAVSARASHFKDVFWLAGLNTWYGQVAIQAVARIYDDFAETRNLVGVAATSVSLNFLERLFQSTSAEGTLMYATMKDSGKLLFSSVQGVSGVWDPEDPLWSYTQIVATQSNYSLIRDSARLVNGDIPAVNPLLWEGYWVTVRELTSIGGLELEVPWLLVFLQPTCLDEGTVFQRSKEGAQVLFSSFDASSDFPPSSSSRGERARFTAANVTKANALGDCSVCPVGATCPRDLGYPTNKLGYWGDIRGIISGGGDASAHGDDAMSNDGNNKYDETQQHYTRAAGTPQLSGDDVDHFHEFLSAFYPCQTQAGATCLRDFRCLDGYAGRHCSRPADRYMMVGGYSLRCSQREGKEGGMHSILDAIVTTGLYGCLCVFILFFAYLSETFDTADLVLNSLQNLALIFSLPFSWPRETYQISQLVFPVVLLGFSESIFPSCALASWTWCHSLVLQFFLTFLVAPAVLVVFAGYSLLRTYRTGHFHWYGTHAATFTVDDGDTGSSRGTTGDGEGNSIASASHSEDTRTMFQRSLDRALGRFLLYIDMSYTGTVLMSFQAFACRRESDGKRYLVAAPDVECDVGMHRRVLPLAWFGVVALGLGYPLCMMIYFSWFRCSRRNPSKVMIDRLGYFFDSYRYMGNYWSVVMLARNFALCLVFTLNGRFLTLSLKGAIGIVVSLLYLGILNLQQPFITSQLNNVETCLVLVELLTVLFGFLFSSAFLDQERFVLEISMNLLFVSAYLLAMFHLAGTEILAYYQRSVAGKITSRLINLLHQDNDSFSSSSFNEEDGDNTLNHENHRYNSITKGCKAHSENIGRGRAFEQGVKPVKEHQAATFSIPFSLCLESQNGSDEALVTSLSAAGALRWAHGLKKIQMRELQRRHIHAYETMNEDLRPFLSDTHELSIKAYDTFWHDLVRAFPRIIGWVLHTLRSGSSHDFDGDKDRIFDVFDKLQRYCERERGLKDVASGIDETAWAPILYWALMETTTQDQIDTMFDILVQMSNRQDKKAIQIGLHLARGMKDGKSTFSASEGSPRIKKAVVDVMRKMTKEDRKRSAQSNGLSEEDFRGAQRNLDSELPFCMIAASSGKRKSFFEEKRQQRQQSFEMARNDTRGKAWRRREAQRRHFLTSEGVGEAVGALLNDTLKSHRQTRMLRRTDALAESQSVDRPPNPTSKRMSRTPRATTSVAGVESESQKLSYRELMKSIAASGKGEQALRPYRRSHTAKTRQRSGTARSEHEL